MPLQKKSYANHITNLGPDMAHTWEWYGKIEWWYGAHKRPNFGKIQAMGNMERKADVLHCMRDLWECIPHTFPIALTCLFAAKSFYHCPIDYPYQQTFTFLAP